MKAYYNEFDPKAAEWLRQLIKNGDITPGEVDERSITEVSARDIAGFDRVHWFSGIGTWDYALNQAGWGYSPVWTASLPCQPFSAAGKGLGKEDERHLLPHFLELIKECRPHRIFGEQVERAIGHGWLDDLQATMEAEGYAVGHCVLGAHSIGAAHIRQRLYWVADSKSVVRQHTSELEGWADIKRCSTISRMGDTESIEQQRHRQRKASDESQEQTRRSSFSWGYCRDGKYRPIEPGIFPLVDGAAEKLVRSGDTGTSIDANATQEARAMRLKGYGNAIQAQTATMFINCFLDAL